MSRLDRHLKGTMVGQRLMLFHAVFLRLLTRGGGANGLPQLRCADRYDTFLGRPPAYIRRQWKAAVAEIINIKTWPDVFRIAGVTCPSPGQMLSFLEAAVPSSMKKGYHSASTDFSMVQKSGVSKILLKGGRWW